MSDVLSSAALWYARRGWHIFPVCWATPDGRCSAPGPRHGLTCQHAGKTPLIRWKAYQQRPPTETEVRSWWGRWPKANIGMATGLRSGRVILDADGEKGTKTL